MLDLVQGKILVILLQKYEEIICCQSEGLREIKPAETAIRFKIEESRQLFSVYFHV